MRWEYDEKYPPASVDRTSGGIARWLTKYGDKGWELVAIIPEKVELRFFFKRPRREDGTG